MKRKKTLGVAKVILAVGMAGLATGAAADQRAPASPLGGYVGTFHPKGASCGECHAKAEVSRVGDGYTLKLDVDYTPVSSKCNGATSRGFELRASGSEQRLLFRNERYEVVVAGGTIEGVRRATNAEVRTVLKLTRVPEPSAEEPPPIKPLQDGR